MKRRQAAIATHLVLLMATAACADITVTNKHNGTIDVRVNSGSQTTIKTGEKAVFNHTGGDAKITIFSGGSEKATTTAKNSSKLLVTYKEGVWTIAPE